jgi:hypothetical protein
MIFTVDTLRHEEVVRFAGKFAKFQVGHNIMGRVQDLVRFGAASYVPTRLSLRNRLFRVLLPLSRLLFLLFFVISSIQLFELFYLYLIFFLIYALFILLCVTHTIFRTYRGVHTFTCTCFMFSSNSIF